MPLVVKPADRIVDFVVPPPTLDFDRPFWHMTTEDLLTKHKTGDLPVVSRSFDELRELVGDQQPAAGGMIFHIGRCGSTLVSRIVGHDRSKLVLREAPPISALHRGTAGSELVPTFTIEQAFKDVLASFDSFAGSRGQSVIVKHSSWESFSMQRMSELLPGTPFVFVYRDPLETVESSLDGYPGWGRRLHQSRAQLQRWIPWLDKIEQPFSAATIFAAVWAAGADAALRIKPSRLLLIDHAQLTAEPETTVARVAAHLHLDLDVGQALNEFDHYSKAKTDGTAFDPSGTHAHPKLSSRTRARVLDVVGDLPARLAEQERVQP